MDSVYKIDNNHDLSFKTEKERERERGKEGPSIRVQRQSSALINALDAFATHVRSMRRPNDRRITLRLYVDAY